MALEIIPQGDVTGHDGTVIMKLFAVRDTNDPKGQVAVPGVEITNFFPLKGSKEHCECFVAGYEYLLKQVKIAGEGDPVEAMGRLQKLLWSPQKP